MRHRLDATMEHTARIDRRIEVGVNTLGETLYEMSTVASDVPCSYTPRRTVYERDETGSRTETPASVTFHGDVDVRESDQIVIDVATGPFEVREIETHRDPYRGTVTAIETVVARAD